MFERLNTHPPARDTQSGNVFFFILLGIVLFTGLIFVMANGMRSQSVSTMSERDLDIAAAEILVYAQKMSRAVDRVRRKGCSENEISFANNIVAGYTNGSAPSDNSCHIFHPDGGGVQWLSPQEGVNDGSEWIFTANNSIDDVGGSGNTADEVLILLGSVSEALCLQINKELDLSFTNTPPQDEAGTFLTTKFTGSFGSPSTHAITHTNNDFSNVRTACMIESGGTTRYFYHTLLIR